MSRTVVVHSRAYLANKAAHQLKLKELYNSAHLGHAPFHETMAKINRMAEEWNMEVQNGGNRKNYYYLHGMTSTEFQFETGRGLHSKDGLPVIKNSLIRMIRELYGPKSVAINKWNSGILDVVVP